MSLPELKTQRTTRTEKAIILSEEQVSAILSDWAEKNFGLTNPKIDYDCESFGIREVEILEVVETVEEGEV